MKSTSILALFSSQLFVALAAEDVKFKPTSIKAPFIEQFTDDWDSRWKPSSAVKKAPESFKATEEDNVEELFRYRGEWAVEKTSLPGDKGLVAKTSAAHHAISASFPKSVDPTGKGLVVQYDVKFAEELQCGGAYIKLLTDSKQGIKAHEFDDRTPFTIMFGPDKCGNTNKVHFIFRHQNPLNLKWEEKHLLHAPSIKNDVHTHLYTLAVFPNNTFDMFVDMERVKSGNLLEDFEPAVNPPREIDDPSDVKPDDWVEEPKIPDPKATKPSNWDDNAPRMIPDEEAVKPIDWLEEEVEYIDDPDAEKPEDWDEEEDGKWIAPQVPNPKCEKAAGCGPWTRPMKPNPDYKGKWHPQLIDNPAFKGSWEPKKIPNPAFFEDAFPSKFTKISGIGLEIWTMQANIVFDNFFVGYSLDDAKKFAEETWRLKKNKEDESDANMRKAAEERARLERGESATPSGKGGMDEVTATIGDFFNLLIANPVAALNKFPATAGIVLLVFLSPTLLFILFSKKSAKDEYGKKKKTDAVTADDNEDADDEKEDDKPRKRKTNKNEE